ncbi:MULTISPECIES: AtpZ/AtpI family protein [Desulfosporosinus]|uniref:AtpZ/AtpI family protein n=1 Tax=Desulfosporosinus nitroreducens TaxID=2018668 RepID=A0ABT8QN14_9FIRM|nr:MULTISPECIES: AtpZ/AtpI family protein [Desulfosporosinus]MCO1601518.1 AtpZ/AtpI family protein [Desulfosporosinus nitroreducens]MCO5386152.1 AtpZ/AtpI family protein [Desulfosporosinus sp.]MDA8220476.1 AtpZ/AtpI family protein [Desulfitobacterium hafniense]MDO0822014.1 AtpZ/AtpI family protein [Desulfosporosinus nitroreducens]
MAEEQRSWQKALVVGSNISTSLAILVGGGFFLGRYLDARWQTEPLFTIGLMLIGLVLGGSYLVITLMKLGASDDKK